MKRIFDWKPQWDVCTAMHKIIEWNQEYLSGGSVLDCMDRQIGEFENSIGGN